ncbi:MAG: lamin tail domain-containing protein, partial [Sedimentisphaerales bacterium]|nr:lamin tail domain-containing protein [Sedimentisphaerales bacterium]
MSKRNRTVILSILVGFCFIATANAELVITEIMSKSHHVGSDGDWWELTNTGSSPVSLTGYSWDDAHRQPGQNIFG